MEPSRRWSVGAPVRRRELLGILLGLCAQACRREAEVEAAAEAPAAARPPPRSPPSSAGAPDPLGSLDEIPLELRPAFDRSVHGPPPAAAIASEAPQSYADFLAEQRLRPRAGARTIALLPIGEFPRGFVVEYGVARLVRSPELALIRRFLEAWFGLQTTLLPAMDDAVLDALPSREHDGRLQYDAAAILDWLRPRLPADAACLLALTLADLHGEDAQWLFGYASIAQHVGVHSMLRYDPGFHDTDARGPDFQRVILTRALRVLAHETAHMFGLRHCVHFSCVMNSTAGLHDLDALPLRMCPVCLRKLWSVGGVSLVSRWQQLRTLSNELGLDAEGEWFDARLHALGVADQ